MRKPYKPNKTESAFTSNDEVRRLSGHTDYKRENGIKDISVDLYDVDYAVKWHIESIINPTVVEENNILTVPVLFAAGEKWAAVQKHGYLRDNQGKLLTPLIMIKRNSVSKREDIQDLKVLESSEARITFERKYTSKNRYDRFNLSKQPPEKELYSVDVPKYVQVEYELLCWTNNTVQLNELVEQFIWFDGKAFGDAHKFITHIDTPTFENINSTGEDRIIRASMPMRTKAYILNTHGPNAPTMYRLNPINKVVIKMEVAGGAEIINTPASVTTTPISIAPVGASSSTSIVSNINSVISYVNTNRQLTGTVVNGSTVTFASEWETAPISLPSTSLNNFIFYVNGQFLEKSAITSFTQSSGVTTLTVNTGLLGFSFASSDAVIGIGKFINQD
jgi:hypothetical protein